MSLFLEGLQFVVANFLRIFVSTDQARAQKLQTFMAGTRSGAACSSPSQRLHV